MYWRFVLHFNKIFINIPLTCFVVICLIFLAICRMCIIGPGDLQILYTTLLRSVLSGLLKLMPLWPSLLKIAYILEEIYRRLWIIYTQMNLFKVLWLDIFHFSTNTITYRRKGFWVCIRHIHYFLSEFHIIFFNLQWYVEWFVCP